MCGQNFGVLKTFCAHAQVQDALLPVGGTLLSSMTDGLHSCRIQSTYASKNETHCCQRWRRCCARQICSALLSFGSGRLFKTVGLDIGCLEPQERDALLPAVATLLRATPDEFRTLRSVVEGGSWWPAMGF